MKIEINIDGKIYDAVERVVTTPIEVIYRPDVIVENNNSYSITKIVAGLITGGKRVFTITAKDVKEIGYGETPAKYYPFGGTVEVPAGSVWVIILKFTNNTSVTVTLNGETGGYKYNNVNNTNTEEPTIRPIIIDKPDPIPTPIEESQITSRAKADVGVITWDWWNNYADTKMWLSPKKYHNRLPWFAKVTGENSVEFGGAKQEIIDKEISWCVDAGIAYWAMNWYIEWTPTSEGSYRRTMFKNSKNPDKSKLKMCFILQPSSIDGRDSMVLMNNHLQSMCRDMGRDDYYKVNGRPLFYILDDGEAITGGAIGYTKRNHVDAIRSTFIELNPGKPAPYIVMMRETSGLEAKGFLADNGADAWSQYTAVGTGATGTGDKKLVSAGLNAMNRYASTGIQHIPTLTLGWDQSPIAENPSTWYTNASFGGERCSPETVKRFINLGLDHLKNNSSTTEANSILMYAFNENAEGGYITPTLKSDGGIDRSILDAVKEVLNNTSNTIS